MFKMAAWCSKMALSQNVNLYVFWRCNQFLIINLVFHLRIPSMIKVHDGGEKRVVGGINND